MQLIIDTSSESSILALTASGKLIALKIVPHANQLSATLLPDIQALVPDMKLLTSIAIGVGPGSYTGTRVGVAVAKTLSFALNIPLYPFCSLLAFLPNTLGIFASVMPSKTQEFYLLKGEHSENTTTISTSTLLSRSDLARELEGVDILVDKTLSPSLEPLIKFLATCIPSEAELIYLHTP